MVLADEFKINVSPKIASKNNKEIGKSFPEVFLSLSRVKPIYVERSKSLKLSVYLHLTLCPDGGED